MGYGRWSTLTSIRIRRRFSEVGLVLAWDGGGKAPIPRYRSLLVERRGRDCFGLELHVRILNGTNPLSLSGKRTCIPWSSMTSFKQCSSYRVRIVRPPHHRKGFTANVLVMFLESGISGYYKKGGGKVTLRSTCGV